MKFVFHKPYPAAKENELVPVPKHLTRDPNKAYLAKKSAADALQKLCVAAERENARIVVLSSHRTYEFQKNYFADAEKRHGKGKGALWVAPPGFSEHHTGYVFDLADRNRPETDDEPSFETTKASNWLKVNAKRFGFELSYPPGNWQGVSYEPWHWRFTGDPEASRLFHPSLLRKSFVIIKSMLKTFGIAAALLALGNPPAMAEKVLFKASDGVRMEGDFLKPAAGIVTLVLLHGYMSNRPEWEPFAKFCHSKGIGSFYYDLRGHGKSQGSPQDFTKMVSDLRTAVDFLAAKYGIKRSKIAVGGASVGANAAFRYFAERQEVPFAILLSPGLNYQGLTTNDLINSYGHRPLLMAASSGDPNAFYSINALEQMARDKSSLTLFRESPSAGHGVQMFRRTDPNHPSDLEKRIVNWIEKVSGSGKAKR